ncbi:MAG: efflux RND transporter periplasmic adaptor subunit [Thermoguttaceae bacterium]|jgi:multidrug efflux system membrane fusion protein
MYRTCIYIFLFIGILAAIVGGCKNNAPQVAPPETPSVPVSQPVQREVTDYVDYTGRTDAIHSVNVQARVTGYLVKMPFKEGAEVKKDDLLFEIDPRPYRAQLDQAQAQVHLYEAQLKLAIANYARGKELAKTPGAISQQDLDAYQAQEEEANAALKAAKSSLEVYDLNLAFTQVTSPIDGQVSRYYLTLGNLVNQDQTLLTTVVSLDPMYAYFDMDETTLLRIKRRINEGSIKLFTKNEVPVYMGLQGEDGYPHQGTVNFVNNQVNPATGSILVRGVFPNPKSEEGIRLLSPGMFLRIRLPIGQAHPALLVIDRAILSDQDRKFIYVMDADKKVQYRRVTVGMLQDDGLRVILDGLKPEDWVVVGSLQQIRPRIEIKPEQIPMPSLGPAESTTPTSETESSPKPQRGERPAK